MFIPSHYLVRIENLHQAVADYEAAGFTVTWGSDPQTAHNALIYFSHGGFLELFEPRIQGVTGVIQRGIGAVGSAAGHPLLTRLYRWSKARGLCDFALETTDELPAAAQDANERGAKLGKIRDFSRRQANGETTHWQLCMAHSADLPFLMGPYTPPPIIGTAETSHANGVGELRGLKIETPNPQRYAQELAVLLGTAEPTKSGGTYQLHSDRFDFVISANHTHRYTGMLVDRVPEPIGALHGLALEAV